MGAKFIDYIIADQHLIPPANQKYFSEKLIYLPNTYMPTDNSREFAKRHISRSDIGLPDNAFIFYVSIITIKLLNGSLTFGCAYSAKLKEVCIVASQV